MKKVLFVLFALIFSAVLIAQDTISTEQATEQAAAEPVEEEAQAKVQKQKKPFPWDKVYFGGYVNFSFGNYTVIGIEPMIAYKLLPKLSVGLKLRYDYISDSRYSETYNTSTYGGSVFSRLVLIRGLYVHAEFAEYNYDIYNENGESDRMWIPYLLVGGGYRQSLGRRSSLSIQVLFDVLQNSNSPYNRWEPFYSVGYGVGF